MATKKPAKYKPSAPSKAKIGKTFKTEMLPFAELEEGDEVYGVFQNRKQITIKDQRTHEPKEVYIYAFRDVADSTKKFALSGRTMLDQAFDEMIEELGGIEKIQGETLKINRGDSIKTSGGMMGTYEISIVE